MSNQTAPQGEQPATQHQAPQAIEAQAAPDGATQGEQPSSAPITAASFENLSPEQLIAVLDGNPDPLATLPAQSPPNQQGEQPQGEAPHPPEEPEKKAPQRLSVRGLPPESQIETAQAIEMVRNGTAPDVLSALQSIRGIQQQGNAPQDQPDGETPQEEQEPPQRTEPTLEEQYDDLCAQRDLAIESFDIELQKTIQKQLDAIVWKRAEQAAQTVVQQTRSESAKQDYNTRYQAAVDTLEAQYPDTLDDNSAFSRLLDDRITAAQARNAPELQNPEFILDFARDIAEMLTPSRGPSPAAPPPANPRQAMGSAVAPGNSPSGRLDPNQVRSLLDNATMDELAAAIAATEPDVRRIY